MLGIVRHCIAHSVLEFSPDAIIVYLLKLNLDTMALALKSATGHTKIEL
jgi:hypothetical protein